MRNSVPEKLESGRIREGMLGSTPDYGFTGAFQIMGPCGMSLRIISSGIETEWEHVSVSLQNRCPNWKEMSFIKDLFWDEEECVVQFHPPKSEYVNHHPHCLHMWRHRDIQFPMPPSIMVGPKTPTPQAKGE